MRRPFGESNQPNFGKGKLFWILSSTLVGEKERWEGKRNQVVEESRGGKGSQKGAVVGKGEPSKFKIRSGYLSNQGPNQVLFRVQL